MKRVHLIISGDVQGVGFRAWLKREALSRKLTGWVKNREDGAVEAVIEGKNETIDQLISLCRRGPEISLVKDVQMNEEEYKNEFTIFEVVV